MVSVEKRLAEIEARKKAERKARLNKMSGNGTLCDCGHYDSFPMATASGTACPRCYDRMSD